MLWAVELPQQWKLLWYTFSPVCGLSGTHATPPRSAAPRAPALAAGHCWPSPPQEANTQRQVCLVLCGVPGSWCTLSFVWALRASLVGMGIDSKPDFTPPTILLGLILCPWTWSIFFWWDPTFSPVDGCSVVSCNYGVLTGENECTSFYSAILYALLEGTNKALCVPGPRRKERWPHQRLNQTCLWVVGVSGGGMGWQWPAVGLGALNTTVLAEVLWRRLPLLPLPLVIEG